MAIAVLTILWLGRCAITRVTSSVDLKFFSAVAVGAYSADLVGYVNCVNLIGQV